MIQGSGGATTLVGVPGFVVGVQELVDGELWLYVETTADVVGCPGCGTRAVGHGRTPTLVRDLPISGRPTVLVWFKRRFRCSDPDCEVATWSGKSPEVAPRAVWTERAEDGWRRWSTSTVIRSPPRQPSSGWVGIPPTQAVSHQPDDRRP